jgi:hypothetical protein
MDCLSFWAWFGSGIVIVPLLALLKLLPTIGTIIKEWAWLIAPLLAALLPQIANMLSSYCAVIDPALWFVIYTALAYLVSQVVFYVQKRFGVKERLLSLVQ